MVGNVQSEKLKGIRLESEDLVNKLQVAAAATTDIPHFEGERTSCKWEALGAWHTNYINMRIIIKGMKILDYK